MVRLVSTICISLFQETDGSDHRLLDSVLATAELIDFELRLKCNVGGVVLVFLSIEQALASCLRLLQSR